MQICETFTSIQGETTHIGKPCFFIRLSKCNLNCRWCDTKYAFSDLDSKEIKIDELIEMAILSGVKLVNVTGGEPLLQENTIELLNKLIKKGFTVLLETNGSIPIKKVPDKVIIILDFKCPSSGYSEKMFLENYQMLKKMDEVKFVIENEKDYRFALNKIEELNLQTKTQNILFSPVLSKLAPRFLANWMIKDKTPAILQVQLHKFIWPDIERGV
ncbi:MAG TPA: 7-carboxy-7-deazaguanine synthase QueE [Lentisphaeria bacterium]|nr:7-carboxy-7-deazaguanine synthase QueE [Lentisphaeria bacterium]